MPDEFWSDGTDNGWDTTPWELLPGVRTGESLSRGERAADIVRNKMGSWGFVFAFTCLMLTWAVVNTVILAKGAFDPYPYILLNLMLSTLAGLQGAILLIAAKRADAIAAEQALSHLTISKTSSEIIRKLEAELAKNTQMTQAVRILVAELHELNKHEKERRDR